MTALDSVAEAGGNEAYLLGPAGVQGSLPTTTAWYPATLPRRNPCWRKAAIGIGATASRCGGLSPVRACALFTPPAFDADLFPSLAQVYKGLHCLTLRDFKVAAQLFLDTVSTFTTTEMLPYITFVGLTVLAATISLDRPQLKAKARGRARHCYVFPVVLSFEGLCVCVIADAIVVCAGGQRPRDPGGFVPASAA